MMTHMAAEIAECPAAAARLLAQGTSAIAAIAETLRERSFPFVVVCGRGSSGHAGVALRYLIETQLGYAVSASAPSLTTSYQQPLSVNGALFVVISQSGRSPDLIAATNAAREGGALTLAIVNAETSPVAHAADLVLPISAGPENAVAATKTVVNSLAASIALVAHWAEEPALWDAVLRLPSRLEAGLRLDWSPWTDSLSDAPATFVTGRGHGFGPTREIALKLAETLGLPALAYSAAELRHGPRAAVTGATPILALRQQDEVAASIDSLVGDLRTHGIVTHTCGGPYGTLPWIGDDHPACDPVVMLVPAYKAIEHEALRRGRNPDAPPSLTKITETL